MSVALDTQALAYLDLVKQLSFEEQAILSDSLKTIVEGLKDSHTSLDDNDLIKAITGRTFTQKEKIELEMQSLLTYFRQRRHLLEGSLTASQVAELLGTSRQTPHDRIKSKTLLGLRDNGVYRFPVWQFDPEGSDGVIEGLPDVLKALQVSDFAKLNWLMKPNPFLKGLTPVEALKQKQVKQVLREAYGVGGLD